MKKKKKIQQRSKIKRMGDDLKHVRACKVTMSFWLFGLIFIRRESRHTRTNICSLHLCLSVSMRSNPKAPPTPPSAVMTSCSPCRRSFTYPVASSVTPSTTRSTVESRLLPPHSPPNNPSQPPPPLASYPAGPCVPVCVLFLLIWLFSFVSMCLHICLDRSSYVGNTDDRMWRT